MIWAQMKMRHGGKQADSGTVKEMESQDSVMTPY